MQKLQQYLIMVLICLTANAAYARTTDKALHDRVSALLESDAFSEETQLIDDNSRVKQKAYKQFEAKISVHENQNYRQAQKHDAYFKANRIKQDVAQKSFKKKAKLAQANVESKPIVKTVKTQSAETAERTVLKQVQAKLDEVKTFKLATTENSTPVTAQQRKTRFHVKPLFSNKKETATTTAKTVEKTEVPKTVLAANDTQVIPTADTVNNIKTKTVKQSTSKRFNVKPLFSKKTKNFEPTVKVIKTSHGQQNITDTATETIANTNNEVTALKQAPQTLPQVSEPLPDSDSLIQVVENDPNEEEYTVFGFKPYLGIAHSIRHVRLRTDFISDIFPTIVHGVETYGGLKLNDYLGFEIGVMDSRTRSKDLLMSEGNILFNDIFPDDIIYSHSRSQVKTYRYNLMGYLPLDKNEKWTAIVGAGVTKIKPLYAALKLGDNFTTPDVVLSDLDEIDLLKFKANKYVFNAEIGFEYKILPLLAVKASTRFEKTSVAKNLDNVSPEPFPNDILRLKDGFIHNIGLKVGF